MTRGLLVALVALTSIAHADPDHDFRAAGELAAKSDPRAVDAFEALGAARPVSRWTDDAWVEAARIAERANDFDRARGDLAQAIAISTDDQLIRRAKRDLERLVQLAGGGGEWSAVAAEHQRLVTAIADGSDPTAELKEMESLARANEKYPRGVALRIALARGWEEEDEVDRGLGWLRDAIRLASSDRERPSSSPTPSSPTPSSATPSSPTPSSPTPSSATPSSADILSINPLRGDLDRARIELVRMLIRDRQLDEARVELPLISNAGTRASLERSLSTAESRQVVRSLVLAILAVLVILAAYLLRRRTGSWRAAAKTVMRPPAEVIYFLPIAAVVGFVATTGNPLVAKAVIAILILAAVIAWISGATLEAARRVGAIRTRHAIVHALVVGVAVLASVYLALDHARILDLVTETWRTGPGH